MWLLDELEKLKDSDVVAVIHRESKCTFKELWNRSESFANYLQKETDLVPTKIPLVIYGNKETDILVAMHAALKSGIPYVPVDTSYPPDRLIKIMKQVGAKLLINFSELEIVYDVLTIDQDRFNIKVNEYVNQKSDKNLWVKDDDDCYILFTSGSTGEPKGVPIKKRNLINFSKWFSQYSLLKNKDTIVLNQPPYSFDLSVIALFVNLPYGNTLFSVDKGMLSNMDELYTYLDSSNLDVWISTPSFLEMCFYNTKFDSSILPSLKRFIFIGETLTKKLVREIYNRFPESEVVNGYGPTECTVGVSACMITREMLDDKQSLPVGTMMEDVTFELFDSYEENGLKIGELGIIGKSVGVGYYKNPERTQSSFWLDKERNLYGYKTGDLVYEINGMFYFIGRIDSQIKLNGYRIELDDISENINKISYVNNSVVLPSKKDGKIEHLVAFIKLKEVFDESALKTSIRIKKELATAVPAYMVPKKIVFVDQFPLNVNGKIDRKKLMEGIE